MTLSDCAINKKCCTVDGGRGICPLFSSPPRGICQLKSPHPREFAIQGKKNANSRGSARGGLGAGGIDMMHNCAFDLWIDFVSSHLRLPSPDWIKTRLYSVISSYGQFFYMPRFIYLCRTGVILVLCQRTWMLTLASEQTWALKTSPEL